MKKKDVAKDLFRVDPQTLRNWMYRTGVPAFQTDRVGKILIRLARRNECPIQGTPHQVKCGIKDPEYFRKCLGLAVPGIEMKEEGNV